MSFSLISFHYPFTVYLLQSLQSLKESDALTFDYY